MKLAISRTIRRLRKEKDVTQEALAAALGVTAQSVSRWENDAAYPDMELIPAIANYFGVTTDVLFGMDAETKEYRLQEYRERYQAARTLEEELRIAREAVREIPTDCFWRGKVCCLLTSGSVELARENLPEIREHFRYVWEHEREWNGWRFRVLRAMIEAEEEEKLDELLFLLDENNFTRLDALIRRYDFLGETDRYNDAVQTHLQSTLERVFTLDIAKRADGMHKDPRAYTEGIPVALSIIDCMRDQPDDADGWLPFRAFLYMRLAAGNFGAGKTEEGFAALEKSLQLYTFFLSLPEHTVLVYHSPLLDRMKLAVTAEYKQHHAAEMTRYLLDPRGWEWFDCVRDTPRFRALVDSMRCFFPEDE